MARRQMGGGDQIIGVGVAASAERFEPLGQIDHFARDERIVEGQHRAAVRERVDTELKRKQHPHELRQHALDFEQVLRFFGNFRHRRTVNLIIVTKSDTAMQFRQG